MRDILVSLCCDFFTRMLPTLLVRGYEKRREALRNTKVLEAGYSKHKLVSSQKSRGVTFIWIDMQSINWRHQESLET